MDRKVGGGGLKKGTRKYKGKLRTWTEEWGTSLKCVGNLQAMTEKRGIFKN